MSKETDELIREYVADGGRAQDWRPAYSVAPTNPAPIVRAIEETEPQRVLDLAFWHWPRNPRQLKGAPVINTRFEKLTDRFWVGAFSNERVIVPMTGYFEWTEDEAGGKQPHFIHAEDGELLSAAGLSWTFGEGDDRRRVFSIITREARDQSGEVHDRMPAFLTPDVWDQWLSPESLTVPKRTEDSRARREAMVDMLMDVSEQVAATITTYEVDRAVNNSRKVDRYDPGVIAPLRAQ